MAKAEVKRQKEISNKFAKLFELSGGYQILFTKEWNEETQHFEIKITTQIEAGIASITHAYDEDKEDTFNNVWNIVDLRMAREFFDTIKGIS